MIKFLLLALLAAGPALAAPQNPIPAPAKHKITCMYDDSGKFTSAESDTPYKHPNIAVYTGRGGSQAWAYTIEAADRSACPARISNQR